MQEDALDDLAASLASNRTSGTYSALPLSRIASPDAAHAVQAAALVAYDNDFIGYTLIGTSSASRRFLALEAPIFAPIANKSHYTEECRIRLPQGMIGAQCELALTIGAAYPQPGQPIDRVSAAEAIVVCQPAIGLVGRRAPPDIDPQLAAIADFGLHVATISGRQAEHVDPSELINATLAAKINDQPVFSCNVGDSIGHPLDALVWLAEQLSVQKKQLNVGDIVTTGSCTPIFQVLPGQRLAVEFERIGSASCWFE